MPRTPEPEAMDLAEEARVYAEADFADVNAAFVERLLQLAHGRDEAMALDLGTGPADIPVRLVRARPHWRIAAVDASFPMLTYAREAVSSTGADACVLPICADAKRLPFPSRAFDIIFSNSILHHITETQAFWSEVRRMGRPGAVVFLRDLARPATPEAARRIVSTYAAHEPSLLQEEYYRSLLSAYTPAEVRAQLDAAGLQTLQVRMVTDRHLEIQGQSFMRRCLTH